MNNNEQLTIELAVSALTNIPVHNIKMWYVKPSFVTFQILDPEDNRQRYVDVYGRLLIKAIRNGTLKSIGCSKWPPSNALDYINFYHINIDSENVMGIVFEENNNRTLDYSDYLNYLCNIGINFQYALFSRSDINALFKTAPIETAVLTAYDKPSDAPEKDNMSLNINWRASAEILNELSEGLIKSGDMESGSITDMPIKWLSNDVDFAEFFIIQRSKGRMD